MRKWVILFLFNMVQVMPTSKKFKKLQKAEYNFGHRLRDILITI